MICFGGLEYKAPIVASLDKGRYALIFISVFVVLLVGRNIFNKPFLAILLVIYSVLALNQVRSFFYVIRKSVSLLVFWGFFVTSYFWSVTPLVTLDIVIVQTSFLLLALLLTLVYPIHGFASSLRTASILLLLLVIAFAVAFPGSSMSSGGLVAFYKHKNNLGAVAAICCLSLYFTSDRRWYHLLFFCASVVIVVLTQSKTSIVLVAVCLSLVHLANFICSREGKRGFWLLVVIFVKRAVVVFLAFACLALIVFSYEFVDFVLNNLSKTAFTGRGLLWLTVVQQIRGDALFGIGPGAFWQAGWASEVVQTSAFMNDPNWVQRMVSADGSYIDLFASLGIIGVILFLVTIVDLYRRVFSCWHMVDSRLIFALTTFVILHGVTESTILYSTNILWLIYLLCYFRVIGSCKQDLAFAPKRKKRLLPCY